MLFGIAMGIIFPFYAALFVKFNEGMLWYFVAGALMAGVTVGLANHFMVKGMLLPYIRKINTLASALKTGEHVEGISVNSSDEIGEIINNLSGSVSSVQLLLSNSALQSDITTRLAGKLTNFSQTMAQQSDENAQRAQSIDTSLKDIANKSLAIESGSSDSFSAVTDLRRTLSAMQEQLHTICGHCATEKSLTQNSAVMSSNAVEHMEEFYNAAKDIDTVANEIMEITKETSILSVNASVEAAGAGVHGKGFGIVAQEIKKLANESEKTAHTINNVAEVIKSQVGKIKQLLEQEQQNIQEISSISEQTSENVTQETKSINTIIETITDLEKRTETISRSSQESSGKTVELEKEVGLLSGTIASNSELVHQILPDITQLQKISREMSEHLKQFKDA